jgi:hypothetical protein
MKPLPTYRDPELTRRCDTVRQLRACQRITLHRITRDTTDTVMRPSLVYTFPIQPMSSERKEA